MKFFIVLAVIALASPLYAQTEEKIVEKRGIIGLGGGYGGGIGHSSYSLPSYSSSVRISSGGYGLSGHGLSSGLSLGHGVLRGGYGGW
ncbi:unnamed protein product [Xylocopa violacea]|uniref:Glycine-rich protein n=1 Tax=Xylocopa violacea TaxID=135666 RepID=A0ABP1NQX4_XYLVO